MTDTSLATSPPPLVEQGDPVDDGRAFRRALGHFATGVTVVTTTHGGAAYGMTVNSFSAVSLDPSLVLWSIREDSTSRETFTSAGHFTINVLAESQIDVSGLFARPGPGAFDEVASSAGLLGDPLIHGAVAQFECETERIVEAGDHLILLGRVRRFSRFDGKPLLFSQGQYGSFSSHPELGDPVVPLSDVVGTADEEALFPTVLKAAHHTMSALFANQREKLGITQPVGRVLNRLALGARTTAEVRDEAFISEIAADDALAELATSGHARQGDDGRWALTESGQQLRAALRRSAEEFTATQVRDIAPADLEVARRVLATLAARR